MKPDRPGIKKTNPECAICRASGKPGFVAFEVGFFAGFQYATNPRASTAIIEGLCERHAKAMAKYLENRTKR